MYLQADRRLHRVDARMAGDHDELRLDDGHLAGGDAADEFETVDPRHVHVRNDDADRGIALEPRKRLFGTLRRVTRIAIRLDERPDLIQGVPLVVDHQDLPGAPRGE